VTKSDKKNEDTIKTGHRKERIMNGVFFDDHEPAFFLNAA